ncbi:DNA primase [Yinghuangia soli]|uniref:DNA primase n=1 Tax=Yinghuangia soli TaxID=2908204 RepID=A0AA41PZM5_9ACTN|nr:DNA primase [Yinghuangia soli]MCF2528532.1 DNA primase [Yinghuangia soli]
MAGRIRDEDVKRVREAARIEDVVGEHLQLRNAGGGNLKGLCPFHDEKSPSFNVSPAKGLYHCFGCQEGGDVLEFVMKVDHLTFSETVERLAAQYNIELRYEEGGYTPGRQQGQRTRLVEAHKVAAQYFVEQLGSAEAMVARQFLADRGFTQADAEHFGIGYAPAGWEHLVRFLRGRGYTPEELLTSGLASEGRKGPMDRFRGRLMWPIRDISGDVIGFGARRLRDDDNGPKYLNTPETPIYKKSQVLYGLDLAKKDIAKSGRAVVVEGYTDVMACHLAGVTGAIATCGTSFGEDHIKILRRLLMDSGEFRGEVIYTFDGDAAGQKAALRAFEEDQKFVTRTFVAVEPNGMDPCDLRQARGDQAVRDLVDARVPLFEFAIRSRIMGYDLGTAEGRVAALDAAAPIVADIKDQALRHTYAVRLDSWLGFLDERFVVGRVGQLARWKRERAARGDQRGRDGGPAQGGPQQGPGGQGGAGQAGPGQRGGRPDTRDPRHMVQREVLKLALQYPALVARVFDSYGVDEFTLPPYASVRTAIDSAGGMNCPAVQTGWIPAVRESAADDAVRALVTELAVESVRTAGAPDEAYAGECLVRLRTFSADRRILDVKSRLQRLDPAAQAEEYAATFQELLDLEKYRRSLIDGGAAAL